MHGNVTNEEWQIFKEAYQYFSDHCLPPANQDENAVDWWMSAAKDVGELDQKWKDYPLMRSLLLAIYEYLEFKAKEKTKDEANALAAGMEAMCDQAVAKISAAFGLKPIVKPELEIVDLSRRQSCRKNSMER